MGSIKRWTPAEYEIIRTSKTIAESMALLPQRTKAAIKTARTKLRVGAPFRRWTKVENSRIRKHRYEPISRLERRFKDRTRAAVKAQRAHLVPLVVTPWKTTDLPKLKKLYSSASRADLLLAFPHRTWTAIEHHALGNGLSRARRLVTAPNELRDAVRARAQEDGISLIQLGHQIGCGSYFKSDRGKTVDLNKIALAVEFFGGKLVIDWQDE